MATESCIEMADLLFESNWQCLPIQMQKYFILMINNVQKPLYYNGYGIIILNLETFTKVRLSVHPLHPLNLTNKPPELMMILI